MITLNFIKASLLTTIMVLGLPVVQLYLSLCDHIFLNTRASDAHPIEQLGNIFLTPTQYLLDGRLATATENPAEPYLFSEAFEYKDYWAVKTLASIAALPYSLTAGVFTKSIAFLVSQETRKRHERIHLSNALSLISLNNDFYRNSGIDLETKEEISSDRIIYPRRPGDENILKEGKEALKAIVTILDKEQVPYWVDVGTCLGVYRHNGVIPWDNDIDIAVLLPDFQNVKRALQQLDSSKFVVQDWSSRGNPNTYLKVWVKESGLLIDIYHYVVDTENGTLNYFLSNEYNIFLTESWRARERKYTSPVPIDMIFPLRKGTLDGIDVYVPNKTKEYLEFRYQGNIDPCMVFNTKTNQYEKDESHPYWQ